jgi:hypothetical protein
MKSGIAPSVCTLLLLYCGTSAAFEYSARAITARVVDAETKEPIEGVVVVAHWQLQGGLEGWSPLAELMVMDAVTDQNGTFHIAAWGPKKIPGGLDSNARLKEFDPQLLLFKSGYRWQMLFNSKSEQQMSHKGPEVRSSDYDGKTIELEKFKGTPEEYWRHLDFYFSFLQPLEHHCAWKGMPRMVVALDQESKRVGHIEFVGDLRRSEADNVREGCGSFAEFLREHEQ